MEEHKNSVVFHVLFCLFLCCGSQLAFLLVEWVPRWGVGGYGCGNWMGRIGWKNIFAYLDYFSIRNPNEVQGKPHVFHPKRITGWFFKHKKHAGIGREIFSTGKSELDFFWCIGNFDVKLLLIDADFLTLGGRK